jgi:heat shock protein HslJ
LAAPSNSKAVSACRILRAARHAALAAAALGLVACAAPPAPAAWPVEGPYWKLQALTGTAAPPAGARETHLVLHRAAGRASGFAGCNRFTAAYELRGPAIRFKPGAMTRMACPDGMEQEQAFLKMLDGAASWRIDGDRLQFLDAANNLLAEFTAGSERFVCDDGKTVMARHDPRDPQRAEALVAYDGEVYSMRAAPAASGARYVIERGRQPDWSLEWRTKGDEGLLLEAPLSDARQPSDLRSITRCSRR